MKVTPTKINGVYVVEPKVFGDDRGFFFESYRSTAYKDVGIDVDFVQDNVSRSRRGVLRGLHLQHPRAQAKLVSVLDGAVFDVAVDVRIGSPTFGQWVGELLTGDNKKQLYLPAGMAHGFAVVSDFATFLYKCSDFYAPDAEITIRWDDPAVGIEWPIENPTLSAKDAIGVELAAVAPDRLPQFRRN